MLMLYHHCYHYEYYATASMTCGLVQCNEIVNSPGDDIAALLQHIGAYAPIETRHIVAVCCHKGALHAHMVLLSHTGLGKQPVV